MLSQLIFKIGMFLATGTVLLVNLTHYRVIWQGSLYEGSFRLDWFIRNYFDIVLIEIRKTAH